MSGSLSRLFLPHLSAAARERAGGWAELEATLQDRLAACRAAWPDLALQPAEFLRYLAERLPAELGSLEDLQRVSFPDLYLAFGCSRGLPAALAHFEAGAMADAERALTAMRLEPELIDEAKQRVRLNLLVGQEGTPPRIVQYQGRGPLLAWVRVAAVREARMRMRSTRRTVPTDEYLLDQLADPEEDQELATFKRLYRSEFRQAFEAALGTLASRERTLLRHHFLDGLSIDEIGAIFGVHRATAARWLVSLRTTLLERTRAGMMQRLQVTGGELESIMRLIESRLDASIHQFLERAEESDEN